MQILSTLRSGVLRHTSAWSSLKHKTMTSRQLSGVLARGILQVCQGTSPVLPASGSRILTCISPGTSSTTLRTFCAQAKKTPEVNAAAAAAAATAAATFEAERLASAKRSQKVINFMLFGGIAAGLSFGLALFSSKMPQRGAMVTEAEGKQEPKAVVKDYGAVRNSIANILDRDGYDDGSLGPVLVRLAWHTSGTFDKGTGAGGSCGATMRFSPECDHGANAGLAIARSVLEPIKAAFPWMSYGDLWTLAGAVAIEEMGGPHIAWRAGRVDKPNGSVSPPDGNLPDATKGAPHIREIFGRMGFGDQELVALSGAHSMGRCHTDRSGFEGPWSNAPTTFSNLYYQELKNQRWRKRKWAGPEQYEDVASKKLMMLPTDMALLWDKKLKVWVDAYAKDADLFAKDFAAAFSKLLELGVTFPEGSLAT